MSDQDKKDLDQIKKEAAQKAREAALAKKSDQEAESSDNKEQALAKEEKASSDEDKDIAKKKAAAAAKAKAAAAAKAKAAAQAKGSSGEGTETGDEKDAAKAKAAAAAKAKAAAAARAKAKASSGDADGDDEKAKAIAAAKAKAKAAAAAKAKAATGAKAATDAEQEEEKPSPNQPILDKYVKVIEEHLGKGVLEDAYINRLSKDVPTLIANMESYYKVAEFLKYNEQLGFDYLSELHGTDFESHMEVYTHLYSYKNRQSVALKVKIDRDEPTVSSLTPLWPGANWPEREAFDLLGIVFTGHPNLTRIMLTDDWVGHPLRKDYEPHDVEV